METDTTTGHVFICLAVLVTVATLMAAGCTGPAQDQQEQLTAAGNVKAGQPAAGTPVMTKTPAAAVQEKTPAPVSSTGVIRIDPIGDRKTGEKFTLTGTTSLKPGTNIFWQVFPDTGTPPTGLDPDSMMSVGGNYQVLPGDGSSNRISIDVQTGQLVPGKYVAIVGKMKGDGTSGMVFAIGEDYGYTYFSLNRAGTATG